MIWGRKSELCLQCQYTNIVLLKFCQFSSTFVRINIIMNTNLTSKTFKDNVGNCLVAIQEIQSGDVVLNDPPLIVGPNHISVPVCLECLKFNPTEVCSKCKWGLCSGCEKTKKWHTTGKKFLIYIRFFWGHII